MYQSDTPCKGEDLHGLAKDGVMNWFPQSTLMYGSGDSMHTSTVGLSPTGKVTILSSLDWGVVSCRSSRMGNMAGNPSRYKFSAFSAISAKVSLTA